jgi:tetratricopeptide (TPR) repeat protein
MALDPSFALPWWGRGNVLRDQDKYDEALAAYDRAIALDPSSALPWNGRGNVLRDQAKYEEALTAYDKAIALDPSFSLPRSGKANVLRGQEKYDEALTAYDEAIALDRASALPWNGRGNVLRTLKRDDDALAAYDKAIALAPSFALPWNGRGNVLRALKRDDEALAAYDKAIALDPSFALPWSNRGNVLRGLRRYDEAIASYDRAVALDPSTGSFYYNKGLVLWSLHRRGAAHTAFRLALERGWDPRWMRVVEMWVQRTAPSKSQAGRKPSAKVAPAERRRSTRPEVPSAGLGADLYETLMDLGLLEAVEESREEMRLALQRGLGAPRRIGVTAEQGALYILRDWNSYTPILPAAFRPQAAASPSMRLGGGYLLSWRGHGVAIDPGINFVDQLYRRGLSIADIDSVVVTHCHLDHTRDVEALVDLNYRFNRNRGATPGADAFRELRFYLARAAHTKYVEYLIGTGCCKEPELMYGGRGPKRISDHIEVRPIRVHHQDISSMDEAIGLVFALKQAQGEPLLVGLTSDSRSEPTLAARFRGCAVLLAHLGTLETAEEFQTTGLKNHLGLRGCHSLMQGVEPTLFVIGEFGEELLESRLEIVRVMAKHKPGKTFSVLGADSNLTIALGSRLGVLCSHPACRQSPTKIPLESVVPVIGNDGLFQYYCPKHSARPE